MEKLDLAIAIAGAAVLVVAIAGSALTGANLGGTDYALSFPTKDTTLPAKTLPVSGASLEFTFDVKDVNISDVAFKIDTTTTVPQTTYTFKVTATPPTGPVCTGSSATVKCHVATPPAARSVKAASQDAAAKGGPAPVMNGTGTWKLKVDVTPSSPVGSPAVAPDSVTVTPTVTTWAASALAPSITPK